MIGIVAFLVAAAVLKSWIPLTAVLAYALSLRGKKAALLGFSVYLLALMSYPGFDSVYTIKGQRELILLGATTVLVLNDALQGRLTVRGKNELALAGILAVSAVNDYTLFAALIGVTIYRLYWDFGKGAVYFLFWISATWLTFFVLRGRLPGVAAEAFVMSALGLAAIAVGWIREAEHAEV